MFNTSIIKLFSCINIKSPIGLFVTRSSTVVPLVTEFSLNVLEGLTIY